MSVYSAHILTFVRLGESGIDAIVPIDAISCEGQSIDDWMERRPDLFLEPGRYSVWCQETGVDVQKPKADTPAS